MINKFTDIESESPSIQVQVTNFYACLFSVDCTGFSSAFNCGCC